MLPRACYHATRKFQSRLIVQKHARFLTTKVAIVGSGPAGFYTTQNLLRNPDIKVDIYEKLPVPFGLVRYGVAPDHADVKNVINTFTNVANNNRVDFYGNVDLGQSIKLEDLLNAYHAVILCYGSSKDKELGIEGERTTRNTISARNFVGWYNGLPEDKDLDVNLDCDTACIIGHGNVALDCARILLCPSKLEKTDITTHAQRALARSHIKKIYIIGRRGPLQVSFTIKELRELIKLTDGACRIEPVTIFKDAGSVIEASFRLPRPRKRINELLMQQAGESMYVSTETDKVQCVFKFLSSPNHIIADKETGRVCGLKLQKAAYDSLADFMNEDARPRLLDEYEVIDCGLIIRSIGYTAVVIDQNLPLDHRLGAILNSHGKVHGYRNLYCSGWLATGASGVIAGTLNSSQITAKTLLNDIQTGTLPNLRTEKPGHEQINQLLSRKSIQITHFNEWLRIDELERRIGQSLGKTREKLVDIDKMLEAAKAKPDQ